jgi:hypothetical protein
MTNDDGFANVRHVPTEQDYQVKLWEIFDWIEAAQARHARGQLLPQPAARSPMDTDNKRTHPLALAHSVETLIGVTIDHLHALAMLVRRAGVLHNSAPFTLCRSAIEAAATAVWMLQPTD